MDSMLIGALALTTAGVVIKGVSELRRRPTLQTSLARTMLAEGLWGNLVMGGVFLLVLSRTGSSTVFTLGMVASIVLFPQVIPVLFSKTIPEQWSIEGLTREEFELAIEKALAKAHLQPERGVTGLRLPGGVVVQVGCTSWFGQSLAYVTWTPRGSSEAFPELRESLTESLSHFSGTRRSWMLKALVAFELLAILTVCWLSGCV